MKALNENIFHQYNKWKTGYERKENSVQIKLNDFLSNGINHKYTNVCHISEDGKHVDCDNNIYIVHRHLIDGKFPLPFGKIKGDFYCNNCKELISLEGAPEEVDGCFYCRNCKNLTSLEGAPKKVSQWFVCNGCDSLTSLEYLPKEIGTLSIDRRFEGQIPSDILIKEIKIY